MLSLPFGVPRVPIWDSLGRFIYVTRLNDIFWWIIEDTFWPNPHQKNYHYNVIILVAVLVVSLLFVRQWKRGLLWAMGTALVLSPVLHPWYCTWILPFAAWRRGDAWQVLSVTIFAYYLFWDERLFLLALALGAVAARDHFHSAGRGHALCAPAQISPLRISERVIRQAPGSTGR